MNYFHNRSKLSKTVSLSTSLISYCASDEENEVYFYDAVEDPGEISSDAESASSSRKSPRLQCLNRKLAALFRKRAQIRNKKVKVKKGSFYIAQYPVRWTAQSALIFCPPWQTCSFRHQLGFSGKHSSHAAIARND